MKATFRDIFELVLSNYPKYNDYPPTYGFDSSRRGHLACYYHFYNNIIFFRHFDSREIDTIAHELVHWASFHKYGWVKLENCHGVRFKRELKFIRRLIRSAGYKLRDRAEKDK